MSQARTRSTGTGVSYRTGQTIRKMREARGWTYQDLSDEIRDITRADPGGGQKISASVLRVMETGSWNHGNETWSTVRRIAVDEAVLLARAFGVGIDELVGGND